MDIAELKSKKIEELIDVASTLNIEGLSSLRKQEMIFKILEAQAQQNGLIFAEGCSRSCPRATGSFVRRRTTTCRARTTSTSRPSQIKKFDLRTGDTVSGQVRAAEGSRALLRAPQGGDGRRRASRGDQDEDALRQPHPALSRIEIINLETNPDDMSTRIMDLLTPIGKGQRGLIVSPPGPGRRSSCRRSRTRSRRTTPRSTSSCCSSTSGPRRSPTWSAP